MNLAESSFRAASAYAERRVPASWSVAKRLTDIGISVAVLTVSLPILLVAMAAIAAVSPGSPVFMQERVGQGGRRFKMLKLRTMVRDAHLMHEDVRHLNELDGPVFKIRNDPRLHPLGAVLRKLSVDELLNFVNVLAGDMSVVGPRPPLPSEVAHYDGYAMRRLTVKPGITCLWQISGRCEIAFDEWMRLDNEYIDTWTPWNDLSIILKTVPAAVRGNGAH